MRAPAAPSCDPCHPTSHSGDHQPARQLCVLQRPAPDTAGRGRPPSRILGSGPTQIAPLRRLAVVVCESPRPTGGSCKGASQQHIVLVKATARCACSTKEPRHMHAQGRGSRPPAHADAAHLSTACTARRTDCGLPARPPLRLRRRRSSRLDCRERAGGGRVPPGLSAPALGRGRALGALVMVQRRVVPGPLLPLWGLCHVVVTTAGSGAGVAARGGRRRSRRLHVLIPAVVRAVHSVALRRRGHGCGVLHAEAFDDLLAARAKFKAACMHVSTPTRQTTTHCAATHHTLVWWRCCSWPTRQQGSKEASSRGGWHDAGPPFCGTDGTCRRQPPFDWDARVVPRFPQALL